MPEVLIIAGIPIALLLFALPLILIIILNIKTSLGAKYSRLKYWIWSVILLAPIIIFGWIWSVVLLAPHIIVGMISHFSIEDIKNTNTLTILFVSFVFMMPTLLWTNVLTNRIRDYGSNPWIALWTIIPLANVGIGLYYGIAKHKSKEKHQASKAESTDFKVESVDVKIEDEIYEQALLEIEEDKKEKATWARALSQTDGNLSKAEALYIQLRTKAIITEKQETHQKLIEQARLKEEIMNRKLAEQEEQEDAEYTRIGYILISGLVIIIVSSTILPFPLNIIIPIVTPIALFYIYDWKRGS